MTDSEFLERAEEALLRIEAAADASQADVEAMRSGHVLTLAFENDSQIVVNLQQAMQEIWVAARSGGFHFRHDGQAWRDTRGHAELFELLSRTAIEQAGACLDF